MKMEREVFINYQAKDVNHGLLVLLLVMIKKGSNLGKQLVLMLPKEKGKKHY
ncbi:hypothetical protein IX317_002146 [Fusobacterium sp. DD29]|nr:hypothetical protein [Fusobacterium sp. DD29]MBR8762665.1 hypothetical protein [Fusobacterium sp. DD25]MBR8768678.1 hypothetical protein [Fusobacterium sp. DD43]MBR8772751.1 hypothetical protein [Fusobacterium sp. DD40]MBR8776960.1 hypothetical protein [Fusobacterium sp. DD17]MBR8799240.1 hypothetical protein [Fusobacterium sp. DD12]MBR8801432.1 hypothetical protein [Fusobacterium sp. DD10]MBR8805713.1 hypothetical protein [Fusobacterium sp. DD13]MBR8812876.1 hypothetical protein [Fusoba